MYLEIDKVLGNMAFNTTVQKKSLMILGFMLHVG